jgi:DNA-binding transcriptional LysR family regulator
MEWGDLAYLLAVARTRSLSGAARQLGVSTSTVARRLDVLERDLALRLVDRRAVRDWIVSAFTDGLAWPAAARRRRRSTAERAE